MPQDECEYAVPCRIGDYTDFYTSVHHATTVGKQFRPDNPLLPNYKWVPIGYHGRASSIGVSGSAFKRPRGQTKAPDAQAPTLGPSKRLDYELELGWFIGAGNDQGTSIEIGIAESHLFGVTLFNDWSARDIQGWEYQPLGPFLSKNFASTVSPWMVTMEALAPFRSGFQRGAEDPQPLAVPRQRCQSRQGGVFHLARSLAADRKDASKRAKPPRVSRPPTPVAPLTGPPRSWLPITPSMAAICSPVTCWARAPCRVPSPSEAGSLMELTVGGKNPVKLPNGELRGFLEDGDTLILRGWCEREGATRIGLGECSGTVVAP